MTSEQRDNRYGTVALVLALVALIASLGTENVVVGAVAACGLIFAGAGIWRGVQVDFGMSRSITALLLSLFALAVWVFSRGGSYAG